MYTVIRKKGCMPDSECLLMASKARNTKLLVHILLDMHVSDILKKDRKVTYIMSTLYSVDVLEAFTLVGMCPTKDDLIRSMSNDMEAVESILWDLKYNVIDGKNVNIRAEKLWSDIIEDPDLNEKLEEIGLLHTDSYLERQVQKGNYERVNNIILHLKRKEDWDPESNFAVHLLNLSLPYKKDIFTFLLNLGIIPKHTTFFKAVESSDINVVKMVVEKMKEGGMFDLSDKGSKRALLQSTLSCDIYNYLIDEGMKPKAYHFLYVVESDVNANKKVEAIRNVYLNVEKHKLLHHLDKRVMHLALLGAFDDTEVYECLLKEPFKLQSSILPAIISRGNSSQLERFIENLKAQGDWPPSFESTKLSLECSFYISDIFEILMKENVVECIEDQNKIYLLAYQILFECRMHSFHKIKEYISIMKHYNLWDPNDIVLKCSVLECSDDQATHELFKENEVDSSDILNAACETGNAMLQSYITAFFGNKDQVNYLNNVSEDVIITLSSFPSLCSVPLLSRAVEVSDKEVVIAIFETMNAADPHFAKSELASHILDLSSKREDICLSLLEKGVCPTISCLLTIVKCGSYELFHDTITSLNDSGRLIVTDELARELVRKSIKRDNTHFYLTLRNYGIRADFEDIMYAINVDNLSFCHLIVNDIEREILETCPEGTADVISRSFPLYKKLRENGLRLKSSILLTLTNSYLQGNLFFSRIRTLFLDFFSNEPWSFEDDTLHEIYEAAKEDKDLFSLLDFHYKTGKESHLLKTLMSKDGPALERFLYQDTGDVKRFLAGAIRKSLLPRKRIDANCIQLIVDWIENNDCDSSLRLLSSVCFSDTENTLQILYELSEEQKENLDKRVLATALEEAIFLKKTGLYCTILKECRVIPTTYCLLYSLYHNDACFNISFRKLPSYKKTCRDPYYKSSLALCCQRADFDKFKILLSECETCDAELLYEAVICKSELIFKLVKETLIKQDKWDFRFKEYWIASAFIEADDNPSIKCQFDSFYDDTVTNTMQSNKIQDENNIYWTPEEEPQTQSQVLTEEDEKYSDYDEIRPEHDYEDLDSFILYENAYWTLQHIHRSGSERQSKFENDRF